jgi:hypothetical protein
MRCNDLIELLLLRSFKRCSGIQHKIGPAISIMRAADSYVDINFVAQNALDINLAIPV